MEFIPVDDENSDQAIAILSAAFHDDPEVRVRHVKGDEAVLFPTKGWINESAVILRYPFLCPSLLC